MMDKLTGELRVGALRFSAGIPLATVQAAIDRLYAKFVEAEQRSAGSSAPIPPRVETTRPASRDL
jgi:hypothetical protein